METSSQTPSNLTQFWEEELSKHGLSEGQLGLDQDHDHVRSKYREVRYSGEYLPDRSNEDATYRRKKAVDRDYRVWDSDPAGGGASENRSSKPEEPRKKLPKFRDLALQEHSKRCIEGIKALACVPAECVLCGKRLPGDAAEQRVTVLIHVGEHPDGEHKDDKAVVFCRPCFDELQVPLESNHDWRTSKGITSLHLEVWLLHTLNITQQTIAAKLSVGGRRIRQPQVSQIIQECKSAMKAARAANQSIPKQTLGKTPIPE